MRSGRSSDKAELEAAEPDADEFDKRESGCGPFREPWNFCVSSHTFSFSRVCNCEKDSPILSKIPGPVGSEGEGDAEGKTVFGEKEGSDGRCSDLCFN
ncbi:hypothetical protein LEP1GSC052_4242 [Leptospira kmetyi serovar Malaysia str. Bejo-Iso9]|nr:hypothetical protein LEP1GSC052_4242 [Leptospira kmetyi serovar Malaysia str. Bejo-Iso9]